MTLEVDDRDGVQIPVFNRHPPRPRLQWALHRGRERGPASHRHHGQRRGGRQTRKRATTGRHGIQSQTDVRQQENGGGVFLIHCGGRAPFSAREWAEFVGRVKRGAFDRPAA